MSVLPTMIDASRNGIATRLEVAVQIFSDSRLLAKLALAMGYKTFGQSFLATAYAKTLRAALWEPDVQKRRLLLVLSTRYLSGDPSLAAVVGATLKWSGAWVLTMLRLGELLKATRLKPAYADAYNNRGNAYVDLKQYDKAIADYTEAIRLKPDYAGAYYNRGLASPRFRIV